MKLESDASVSAFETGRAGVDVVEKNALEAEENKITLRGNLPPTAPQRSLEKKTLRTNRFAAKRQY